MKLLIHSVGGAPLMIQLSPRLAVVARYVLPGRPLADIGTDHAYLPVHLVQAGLVPHAVAADMLAGPLEAARATVAESAVASRVDVRMGNGLAVLQPGEVKTVAICGMGGSLIAEILTRGPLDGVERLVLQPLGGELKLRGWLAGSGWRLVAERLVEEGARLYVIMVAEPGSMTLSPAEELVGPCLIRTGGPLLARYAGGLLLQTRRALAGARRSRRSEAMARSLQLAERVKLLEEVIAHAQSHSGEDLDLC